MRRIGWERPEGSRTVQFGRGRIGRIKVAGFIRGDPPHTEITAIRENGVLMIDPPEEAASPPWEGEDDGSTMA
jgi:hypothetical protein